MKPALEIVVGRSPLRLKLYWTFGFKPANSLGFVAGLPQRLYIHVSNVQMIAVQA